MPSDLIVHGTAAEMFQSPHQSSERVRRAVARSIRPKSPRHEEVVRSGQQACRNGDLASAQVKTTTWRLGLITDRGGHLHLGAVLAKRGSKPAVYIDLLAAVGAAGPAELDLDGLVVLVRGKQVADLRRLVDRCIDDLQLRNSLVKLTEAAASEVLSET